jgi:hypothetical protein
MPSLIRVNQAHSELAVEASRIPQLPSERPPRHVMIVACSLQGASPFDYCFQL